MGRAARCSTGPPLACCAATHGVTDQTPRVLAAVADADEMVNELRRWDCLERAPGRIGSVAVTCRSSGYSAYMSNCRTPTVAFSISYRVEARDGVGPQSPARRLGLGGDL
jgi:hypothetical protein